MSDSWLRFWDRPNAIYANDRHRQVHYARIADDILSVLPPGDDLQVLDYGCGEARDAARVAQRCGRLLLYDAAASVRRGLAERFSGTANITVLDEAALAALRAGSLDVITVCSVLQYIERPALAGVLDGFQRILKPDGLLVVADVVPPENGMIADAASLLMTGARHGFLMAALRSLGATLVSDYRRMRLQLGLSTYGDAELRALLDHAGFDCTRKARNFGFNQSRRTYLAHRRRAEPSVAAE